MAGRQYFNRYSNFVINGQQTVVPYVNLPSKSIDKRFIYKSYYIRFANCKLEFTM